MTLNFLGSQMTISQLARQFGVTTNAFIQNTERVMQVMMDKARYVIKWPNREDYDDIAAKFNKPSVRYMYMYQEIPKCNWCHRQLSHQDSSKSP